MTVSPAELRRVPLFTDWLSADLERICGLLQEQAVRPKRILFVESVSYSGLHIVKAGRVKLVKGSGAKEQILEIAGPGDFIDPVPLFDSGGHSATAKTMTPVEVYHLPPSAAQELLDAYPAFLAGLLNLISVRLRRLATLANDLAFKDVTTRLCKTLLEQATVDGERTARGVRIRHAMTRQDLAALIGTAREVAWRSLKRLEQDGLIEIDDHEIVIRDVERLKTMA